MSGAALADETRQSRADAWWTGPLLAPSAATMPQGHALIEPYLFDAITDGHIDADGTRRGQSADHAIGSLTYMLYGVTDRLTAGLLPRFGYHLPASGASSPGIGVGDLTVQAGYGLTRYEDGSRVPSTQLVIQETLPNARYDRLSGPADGFGSGVWTTVLALYTQDYFWMPNGRILRARLDLTYTTSTTTSVQGLSVYGTANGFTGRAAPGNTYTVDAAGEYSLTRNWVLALDLVYQRAASTWVRGEAAGPAAAGAVSLSSGASYAVTLAPAIEYNFSATVGLICGVRISEIGRNIATSLTPAVALNMVL